MSFSKKQKKQSGSSGFGILLAAAIGAGIGFLASKIFQDDKKKQKSTASKLPVLESKIQVKKTTIDNYDNIEQLMICPITQEIMSEPYILTPCGHSFEKNFIENWVKQSGTCPLCKVQVNETEIKLNYHLKEIIHYYQYTKNNKSPQGQNNNSQKQ